MSTEPEQQQAWPEGHRWSEQLYAEHHGDPVGSPAPRLLGQRFTYTPGGCLRGFRVMLLNMGNGAFVCPFCGLLCKVWQ